MLCSVYKLKYVLTEKKFISSLVLTTIVVQHFILYIFTFFNHNRNVSPVFVLLSHPVRGINILAVLTQMFIFPTGNIELAPVPSPYILPQVRGPLPHAPQTLGSGRLQVLQGFRAFDPGLDIPEGPAWRPADLLCLDLLGLSLFPLYPVPLLSRQPRSNI